MEAVAIFLITGVWHHGDQDTKKQVICPILRAGK